MTTLRLSKIGLLPSCQHLKNGISNSKAVVANQYTVIGGSLPIYTQFSQYNYRKLTDVL
ncbi:12602_t:CDS:1, partial [Funneliformis geosporum]